MDIKPIETIYNGYRFRSRLEARWAVFFDELPIRFEYELEGYEMPGGLRYLPDFYLPDLGLYVEAKPNLEISKAEWRKLVSFASDADRPTVLIAGTPGQQVLYLLDRKTLDSWSYYETCLDDELTQVILEGLVDHGHVEFGAVPGRTGWQLVYKTQSPWSQCTHGLAIEKAKQARFEHGERGRK